MSVPCSFRTMRKKKATRGIAICPVYHRINTRRTKSRRAFAQAKAIWSGLVRRAVRSEANSATLHGASAAPSAPRRALPVGQLRFCRVLKPAPSSVRSVVRSAQCAAASQEQSSRDSLPALRAVRPVRLSAKRSIIRSSITGNASPADARSPFVQADRDGFSVRFLQTFSFVPARPCVGLYALIFPKEFKSASRSNHGVRRRTTLARPRHEARAPATARGMGASRGHGLANPRG